MYSNLSGMAYVEAILILCSMVTFMVGNCETKSENSSTDVSLPGFLSELNLSDTGALVENEESLRKLVKRLAPEKNGEYQVYQVFFGNADLLKEWLRGAGVTGQPGVDFPALTTIPATSFSCRGLKGGYYADLETNCQVFHICDNGRKISFLCPNGTIFQQSQLICDWWFKVDCSKSAELYEQSSEQFLEDERRRAESRKSKPDYQQSIDGEQQDYYDVQNLNYDGKQNGRIKPYEEPPQENQVQPNRERLKPSRHFDSGNSFNQESNAQRNDDQLFEPNGFQQSPNSKQQFSQYRNTEEGNINRHSTTSQDYYSTPKKTQNHNAANRNQGSQRDDKGTLKRLKFKGLTRNNTLAATRPTPAYTESTTFRASNTSPVKESQQFAESAAFVGRSGNRFNDNSGNNHQYYYQLYINRDSSTRNPNYDSTTWRQDNNDVSTQRPDFVPYTDASAQYETTTVPCNEEITTDDAFSSTNFDAQSATESLQFANSNYEYRGNGRQTANVRTSYVDRNAYNNRDSNKVANNAKVGTIPSTTRSYVTTDAYRNTLTPSSSQQRYTTNYFSSTPTASVRANSFVRTTERPVNRNANSNQFNKLHSDTRVINKNPSTASPGYRQNLVSTTTDKPRTTLTYQPNTVTEKDLSPYDRSFTYKQGKVMSTLGPYVPFTKNYASTTSKPAPYTPTVPTYTTAYTSPKPRLKYPAPTSLSKIKPNADRLSEREHAISMLNTLKSIENSVPSLSDALKETEKTYNVSVPPAVSTLHSLALYFSTATENFDSNETTDSSVSMESAEEEADRSREGNGTVKVPSGILTQHTLNSYAELFRLNDAAESNNVTMEDRLDSSNGYEDYEDDLELQQSGGSLDDLRRSNSTRLRELAQVFTHALSAYLLDPDAFKKVLTEIRPTEPSLSTEETDDWRTTTVYPLDENNTLLIRERDEVLDYSEDANDIRQKLTTVYPTTFESPTTTENVYDTLSTLPSSYYTTPRTSSQDVFEYTTNFVPNTYTETTLAPTESTITAEQNSTPYESESSKILNQNNVESTTTDNYDDTEDIGAQNRVGGFQNNSATTVTESYEEKLIAITPASDNYVVSPTPSPPLMHMHMVNFNWNKKSSSRKPEQQLTPPYFDGYLESIRKGNDKILASLNPENYPSTPISAHSTRATTFGSTRGYETSTVQPRKAASRHKSLLPETKSSAISRNNHASLKNVHNRVDEVTERSQKASTSKVTESVAITTTDGDVTPCENTDSSESFESSNEKEESKDNDHWTSSPIVTNLWKTSVFVDPQRINHDLGPDYGSTVTSGTFAVTDSQEYGNTRSLGEDISSSSEESFIDDEDLPPPAQRLSRDKDSPTTFSLLPTSFTTDNTATAKPLITTKSSITATITSTVTSTKTLPQESLVTLLPQATLNGTENEIADKLFGKLNASSTNTLMRVMKEVDSNETVRQLVLLLIRHCSDPTNKTMQREKDELLNALLKLPVSEFSSEESRSIVAGINQLSVPVVRSTNHVRNTTPLVITEPPVTTFRNRKSRRFRTTTESSANIVRRSEKVVATDGSNSLQEDEASASDNRALELLRSLYTIATKWG